MRKTIVIIILLMFLISGCKKSETVSPDYSYTMPTSPSSDYSLQWKRQPLNESKLSAKIENSYYCYDPKAYKLLTDGFKEWLDENCGNIEYNVAEDEKVEFSKQWEQPINFADVIIADDGTMTISYKYYSSLHFFVGLFFNSEKLERIFLKYTSPV